MTKKNLLGDFTETPPLRENSILPQSAATPERASSSSRPRDPASRRDLHFRQGHRSKHHASPTSISRAILKAREDITALSLSLRETSSAQAKMSSPRRFPQYAPSPTGKSTSSDRVVRLLAMQQQIDVLATSIMEIQESLSGVRQGLAAALAGIDFSLCFIHGSLDELSAQEQVMDSPKKPTRAAATSPIPPPQLDTLEPSNFENPVSVPINETEPSIPDLVGDMPTNPISSTPDDVRAARAKYFANSTANSVNGEGARDVSVVSSAGSQDSARVIPEADLEEASKTVKEDAEQTAASTTFKEEVEG